MSTTIGKNIKNLRLNQQKTLDDIAKKTGVSRQTIQRYESGVISNIPSDKIEKIATALNTTPAYLMGWEDSEQEFDIGSLKNADSFSAISKKRFPLLGNVACGEPVFADGNFESYVEAGADIKADFCLRAKGDSMIGARIHDGDIVFVRKQSMVDNGEIAVVIIDNEATLKRVSYYPDKNLLILKPENPNYQDYIFSDEQLDSIVILGKAVAFQSDVK